MEWGASSFTTTGELGEWGIRVRPMEFRFTAAATHLAEWLELGPTDAKPLMSSGTAHAGHEILKSQKLLGQLMTPIAALITPSEIDGAYLADTLWTHRFWVDSSTMDDVLGGRWIVFLRTEKPLGLMITPIGRAGGITLAARYDMIGRPSDNDPEERRLTYSIPYSVGAVQDIVVVDRSREFRILSRNSQLAAQSLTDIWQRDLHIPLFAATQTRPSISGKIVIFGGWARWEQLGDLDKGLMEDAMWRATPRGVWELVMKEIFRNIDEHIPGAPKAVYVANRERSTGGGLSPSDIEGDEIDVATTLPDLSGYYERDDEDRYRVGGRQLAHAAQLPFSTSFQDSWSEEATRRLEEKQTAAWEINSDSATKLVNEKVAGNRPLPTTHTGITMSSCDKW